jgi:hypothetical protein
VPGPWAAATPIGKQGFAKHILADALDQKPLGFRGTGEAGDCFAKAAEWRIGQADAQPVNTVEGAVEVTEGREDESGGTRAGVGRDRCLAELGSYSGTIDGQQPGASLGCASEPDFALSRGWRRSGATLRRRHARYGSLCPRQPFAPRCERRSWVGSRQSFRRGARFALGGRWRRSGEWQVGWYLPALRALSESEIRPAVGAMVLLTECV